MQHYWKWHSVLQSTSQENVISLEIAFITFDLSIVSWEKYKFSALDHVNNTVSED